MKTVGPYKSKGNVNISMWLSPSFISIFTVILLIIQDTNIDDERILTRFEHVTTIRQEHTGIHTHILHTHTHTHTHTKQREDMSAYQKGKKENMTIIQTWT